MILKEDEVFHGRYRIISRLGDGSVGVVYRAEQLDSGREVALKLLHASTSHTEVERERFLREFRILSQLSHDHIMTFYSAAISPEGMPYAVFEYINGENLHHVITREKTLPFSRTLKIAEQICLGMDYAHKHGIIHRDLKPENIMLLQNPEPDFVKILDFGFARDVSTASTGKQKLTATGMVVGTVCYMSPEQCKGAKAENQSDIYALACIMYECITGNLLFEADSPLGVVHKQIYDDPTPALKQLQGQVPDAFIAILKKALSKEPEKRQKSMAELLSELQSLPREHQPSAAKPWVIGSTGIAVAAVFIFGMITISLGGFLLTAKKNTEIAAELKHPNRTARLLSVQSTGTLMDEAENCIVRRDFPEAGMRLKLALDKAMREHDKKHIYRANSLITKLSMLDGDMVTARFRAAETIAIAQKIYGKESIECFRARKQYADTFYTNIESSKRKQMYKDLLDEWSQNEKIASLDFAITLDDYAAMLRSDGNKVVDREVEKYKDHFNPSSAEPYVVIKFLAMRATNKYLLGKRAEADEIAKLGTELAKTALGISQRQQIDLLTIWARVYFQAGENDKAIQQLHEAESRIRSPDTTLLKADLYITEANIISASGNMEHALATLDKAYALVGPQSISDPSELVSKIWYSRACCYEKNSLNDKALNAVKKAIRACPADATATLLKCSDLRKIIESKTK